MVVRSCWLRMFWRSMSAMWRSMKLMWSSGGRGSLQ
jgi:hypothetical protein